MSEGIATFTSWRYHAGEGGLVWRLMFTGTGVIFAQKRFREQRRSLFFAIEEHSGRVLFDDYLLLMPDGTTPAGEGWFTGIETITGNMAFLHAYRENSPEHFGLWAIDAFSGTVVWSRADIVFCGVLDEGFLVYRPSAFAGFPERHYQIVDPVTGIVLRSVDADSPEVSTLRSCIIAEEERQGVVLPEFADAGSGRFAGLLAEGVDFPGRCEFLFSGPLAAAAFHELEEASGTWRSTIRVWLHGTLVHEDAIAEMGVRPALGSFLVHGRCLYYTKGESELVALKI